MRLKEKLHLLNMRLFRSFVLVMTIFFGYLILLEDLTRSTILSLISINFTIASFLAAALTIQNNLDEKSYSFLLISIILFLFSNISLFYTAFGIPNGVLSSPISSVGFILSGLTFSVGMEFLLNGIKFIRDDREIDFKEVLFDEYNLRK